VLGLAFAMTQPSMISDLARIRSTCDAVLHVDDLGALQAGAALYGREHGARDKARPALGLLAEIATRGTDHFGEVWLRYPDGDGGYRIENVISMPHVWEGALFYLAAMALTDPSGFNRDAEEFPLPDEEPDTGCGCSNGTAGRTPVPWALLFLVMCATFLSRRMVLTRSL